MKSYLKIILILGLSGLNLFASHNHASDINKIEAQALAKLTQQLRTNTPANIKPELDRLDEITIEQIQDKANSLQAATNVFGAATIGALFIKATERAPLNLPISHRTAATAVDAEATKMFTGIEFSALAALLPSGETIFYNAIVITGLYLLYQANKAIHAPCRAKFDMEAHKWGNQLRLIRKDTERRLEETERILEVTQTELKQLDLNVSATLTEVQKIKANQLKEKAQVATIGTKLSGIQETLDSMSRKAKWDLSKFHERHTALSGLKDQQESMRLEQELQAAIAQTEADILSRADQNDSTPSSGSQRSAHHSPKPHVDSGAGVGPARKPVDEVGYFGCYGRSLPKKPTELR